jgi:hypothetical protein
MPLVAVSLQGDRVELWRLTESAIIKLRDEVHHGKRLVCPECGGDMLLKAVYSEHITPHFAHKPSPRSKSCNYGKGESLEHMATKLAIAKHISKFGIYDGAMICVEYKINIPYGNKKERRADVVAIMPNGDIHVHEAQLSAITIESLQERTADYRQVCAEVVWWLGKDAANFPNELEAGILGVFGAINTESSGVCVLTDIDIEEGLVQRINQPKKYFTGLYFKAMAREYHPPKLYSRLISLIRDHTTKRG